MCTKETACNVKKAAEIVMQKQGDHKVVKVVSLGSVEGCTDLVEILKTFSKSDEVFLDPIGFTNQELKGDTCMVFWTSGTTGLPKGK